MMNRIKPPYNINQASQELVLKSLEEVDQVNQMIKDIVEQRTELKKSLESMTGVEMIYPSDANFLLVKIRNARALYEFLLTKGIVVRDRSNVSLCEGCLRITVGTAAENAALISAIDFFMKSF